MNSETHSAVKQYAVITGNYWVFTLTDGALRFLVLLHFHQLGYSPFAIASLFLFYEAFGIATNLLGGWLGARIGLNLTMNIGLGIQIVALLLLMLPDAWLSIPMVMAAQALSGVAKDLNKMSAKSAIKLLVPAGENSQLYRWVALLTGSKNALKGAGFFLGGLLLSLLGFRGAIGLLALCLALTWGVSLCFLKTDLGKTRNKPKFSALFSTSYAVNVLSAARLFLFGARDVWFVIAIPVYFSSVLGWSHWAVSGFMALWVIGYAAVQALTPTLTRLVTNNRRLPLVLVASVTLLLLTLLVMIFLLNTSYPAQTLLITGLIFFALFFAVSSSVHSYLILHFARAEGVSLDVGFYYMANAIGRLLGTLLSGYFYQQSGLTACLWIAAGMMATSAILSILLPSSLAFDLEEHH